VTINVISYLNPAPAGQPITSASATCVGEPVTLSITGTNDIPGYNFVRSLQWNVPNAIKNYNPNALGYAFGDPPIISLTVSDGTSSPIAVYYPIIPQSGISSTTITSGTTPISCNLTLITGGTCTVSGLLRLVAPAVQITGSMPGALGTLTIASGTTSTGLLGDGYNRTYFPTSFDGMDINSSGVTPPQGFTSGSATYLQVITDVISAVTSGTYASGNVENDVDANDHGFPYGTWEGQYVAGNVPCSVSDSPLWHATEPPQTELDRTFTGWMYNMWISDVPKSIWVPLSVMDWGFKGQINWSPTNQEFIWGGNATRFSIRITAPPGEPTWQTTSF
jgi:hypothetical protein